MFVHMSRTSVFATTSVFLQFWYQLKVGKCSAFLCVIFSNQTFLDVVIQMFSIETKVMISWSSKTQSINQSINQSISLSKERFRDFKREEISQLFILTFFFVNLFIFEENTSVLLTGEKIIAEWFIWGWGDVVSKVAAEGLFNSFQKLTACVVVGQFSSFLFSPFFCFPHLLILL